MTGRWQDYGYTEPSIILLALVLSALLVIVRKP